MIAYFLITTLFIFQMFLKTIIEFLQIYQKNMTRVLDQIFYAELREYNNNNKRKKRLLFMKSRPNYKAKIKAPLVCQYLRSLTGLFWLYPAILAEAWFSLFLGREFQCEYNKKLK